jgi:Histidine kinase-, DNA gyrase B-, and HSP90-like ATPase
MIIADEKRKVVRSSGFQESTFKIETSSKAFNILSSKLYSDQYQAIVRELCTNASDAHVNAGIGDVPIEVHFPDFIDHSFSVRDHGKGIDPEEFEKIYTTYFYSTKTSSDTQVGCFGLGSKSPFAYTKQFTVENNYNGHKYVYLCFENENGEPSVSLLANSPTEDKGVKVSFAVKHEDRTSFNKAVTRVLSWFDITPKINNSFSIKNLMEGKKDQRIVLLSKADGFDKYEHTSDYSSTVFVRMGQVLYPCESEIFKNTFIGNKTVVINANIGDVDITPSRESLEYRSKTNGFIQKVKDELIEEVALSVKNAENNTSQSKFEKFKSIFKVVNDSGLTRKFVKDLVGGLYPSSYDDISYFTLVNQEKLSKDAMYCQYDRWRDKIEMIKIGTHGNYRVTEDIVIVIKDKNTNFNLKMKELQKASVSDNATTSTIFVIDVADKDVLIKECGFEESDFLFASKLTFNKDSAVVRTGTGNNCTAMTYTINGADRKGIKLDKDTKDGYYLKDGEYYGLDTSSINNRDVIGDKTVYIFTDNQYNSLKVGERNFVNFLDYLVDEVQTNKDEIIRMLSKDNMRSDKTWKAFQDIHTLTDVASIIDDYVLEYNDCQLDSRKIGYYEAITNIIRRHNHSLYQEIQKAIGDLDIKHCEAQNKIKEKYPLLKVLIDNRDFDGIIKQVAQYVDLVSTTIQKDGEV